MMAKANLGKLAASIAVCELAGIVGSLFTVKAIPEWYVTLPKPFLSPPSWLFGPVWTLLYLLMGIAIFLIWKNGFKDHRLRIAFAVFCVQLVLNGLWSILFFGLRNPGLAFLDLAAMWIGIIACIHLFAKISRPAAWLMVPYLAWVTFAGYLNFAIWWAL